MRRQTLLAICVTAALGLTPAYGQTVEERFIAQLKSQGYTEITVTRTWLRRTRITASSASSKREIIFNGRTGEVLRDYWQGNIESLGLLEFGSGGSGGSGSCKNGTYIGSCGSGGGGGVGFNYLTGGQEKDIPFKPMKKQRGSSE